MTAPERIWAWEQPGGLGSVRGWTDRPTNSTEYIRADLVADQIRAAVQAEREACAVDVVPLVWHEGDEPYEWKSGPYDVFCEFGDFQLYYWSVVMGDPHKTADSAKAAAQLHHEGNIRTAIRAR